MEKYYLQILETVILMVLVFSLKFVFRKSVRRMANRLHLNLERKRMAAKTVDFIILLFAFIALIAIWSINSSQLFFFISSLLTAMGIAFFAQWSLLSNITANLILFFNHPIKIGCHLKILDKEFPIEGIVTNISLIFLHIRLENGEHITIPNNIALNRVMSVIDNEDDFLNQ